VYILRTASDGRRYPGLADSRGSKDVKDMLKIYTNSAREYKQAARGFHKVIVWFGEQSTMAQ
jgi:hypothetical protein